MRRNQGQRAMDLVVKGEGAVPFIGVSEYGPAAAGSDKSRMGACPGDDERIAYLIGKGFTPHYEKGFYFSKGTVTVQRGPGGYYSWDDTTKAYDDFKYIKMQLDSPESYGSPTTVSKFEHVFKANPYHGKGGLFTSKDKDLDGVASTTSLEGKIKEAEKAMFRAIGTTGHASAKKKFQNLMKQYESAKGIEKDNKKNPLKGPKGYGAIYD